MESGPKTYSTKEILAAIEAEGFEIKKQPSEIPFQKIDYSGLESDPLKFTKMVHGRADTFSKTAKAYLTGIIVTDSFGENHSKRREWRLVMKEKYGNEFIDLYLTNKLRINMISWVKGDLHSLASGLNIFKVHSPKADAIRKLAAEFPDISHYDEMNTEEKLEVTEKIDAICQSFLDLISQK